MAFLKSEVGRHTRSLFAGVVVLLTVVLPAGAAEPVNLNREGTVAIDKAAGRLLLRGEVVLDSGPLEMLVCREGTKEHESIIAVDTRAATVHAGLVALGFEPGEPVTFDPEFRAPTGPALAIEIGWTDVNGNAQTAAAESWVRRSIDRFFGYELESLPEGLELPEDSELRFDPRYRELSWYGPMSDAERDRLLALSTDKAFRSGVTHFYTATRKVPLDATWVFAGSRFFLDPATGRQLYGAEGGELICVANFPAATIDIAEKSSAANAARLYEAWTDRIPPVGTRVVVTVSAAAP